MNTDRPNDAIGDVFDELADLLEIEDENPFRVIAYRNAASTIRGLGPPVAAMRADGADLSELDGIGPAITKKIDEILATGSCDALEKARERTGGGLAEVLRLPGLGAKRVRLLRNEFGIRGIDDVERLAASRQIQALPGLGARTEERILDAIRTRRERAEQAAADEDDEASDD